MNLKVPTKIEIKESPGRGLGVFATKKIFKNEVIEECHLLPLPVKAGESSNLFNDYRFNYPQSGKLQELVIPFGYGCIYNHSDNNNATWKDHPEYKAFQFIAIKDINPGEEICTYYGDSSYWEDGRQHIGLL